MKRRVLRLAERIVRWIGGHLSPPREAALVKGFEASLSLVTGRAVSTNAGLPSGAAADLETLREADSALARGDLQRARDVIDELYRRQPASARVLRLRREVCVRTGSLTEATRMLHELHRLEDTPETRDRERLYLGRLQETTPGWLPRVPGPARPIKSDGDDLVLHLVKESLPELTNGFTLRTHYNLLAARAAGVRPVVVTALGFPRLLGVNAVPAIELVDGIPHHRLDLGPNYPLNQPVDVILEDQAWLTAAVAQRVRPAVIHASSGHRGFEYALVGAALRAHIHRPLVYEVRSSFEATWSKDVDWNEAGEVYERRFETESRMIRSADHLITISAAMRADLVDRGADPDRITVIPNGVDANVFSPRPKDADLARRYGLEDRFTFGYVSNLDHRRENQELLIDATRVLLERGRRVACLIVGDGIRRAELEAHARSARVGDAVVFTGNIPHDEVAAHYALLDAFVVPRRDDRASRLVSPLKPFEALAMARPLVVADLPPLLEIADPEERGLAFVTGDVSSLAAVLERLEREPSLAARLGAAGRDWVVRERSWAANGQSFRDVYRRVLAEWAERDTPAA